MSSAAIHYIRSWKIVRQIMWKHFLLSEYRKKKQTTDEKGAWYMWKRIFSAAKVVPNSQVTKNKRSKHLIISIKLSHLLLNFFFFFFECTFSMSFPLATTKFDTWIDSSIMIITQNTQWLNDWTLARRSREFPENITMFFFFLEKVFEREKENGKCITLKSK